MELTTTHQAVARETRVLIHDAMGFSPKDASRNGGVVLYLKQSEQISTLIGELGKAGDRVDKMGEQVSRVLDMMERKL